MLQATLLLGPFRIFDAHTRQYQARSFGFRVSAITPGQSMQHFVSHSRMQQARLRTSLIHKLITSCQPLKTVPQNKSFYTEYTRKCVVVDPTW